MSLLHHLEFLEPLEGMPDSTRVVLVHLNMIDPAEAVALDYYLDKTEKQQLKEMANENKKHTFRVCRFIAKQLISEFFDLDIVDLHFEYNARGKPILPFDNIEFNISHSADLALIGVSAYPIGVDIEIIKQNRDLKGLAHKVLSADEHDWMYEEDSEKRFYALWTLKEARLKCDGEGLSGEFPSAILDDEKGWGYPGYEVVSGYLERGKSYACAICIKNGVDYG